MTKLESIEHKIFASEAPLDEIGQFGSALDTTKLNTKDVTTIQALPAYTKGWGSAIISNSNYPTMEEMNGVLNVMSYHTGYLYQEGMPAWRSDREYSATSIVKEPTGTKFFRSLKDGNIGNAIYDTEWWEELKLGGSGLEICDIGMALYVDETKGLRRYLNGQIVDINTNTQAFLNRLKQITTLHPSLLCTEEEWQTAKTMSAFGQVGKFVFNYSGEDIISVRIPRVVNVRGLFDLQNLGMTVGQALPSHTHTRGTMDIGGTLNIPLWTNRGTSGAFYEKSSGGVFDYGSNSGGYTAGFTASRNWTGSTSAPNYSGTVATGAVQQEAIQYPYFIQIATGSETENNIINEIELNTLSFFGDSKYVPTKVNNLSWLKSEGQNNPKGTYPSFYDWILENVNKGEEGFKLSTATDITDYDFVINTANETFRLPLKNGMEGMFIKEAPVVGNGKTLGLTNGSAYADLSNVTVPLGWNLYYYVGETVQNANLIDAGRIGEILPTKTDMQQAAKASMPSRYIDLTLGAKETAYTAPADGWVFLQGTVANGGVHIVCIGGPGVCYAPSAGNFWAGMLPIRKGDQWIIFYSSFTENLIYRFYYAEGAQ